MPQPVRKGVKVDVNDKVNVNTSKPTTIQRPPPCGYLQITTSSHASHPKQASRRPATRGPSSSEYSTSYYGHVRTRTLPRSHPHFGQYVLTVHDTDLPTRVGTQSVGVGVMPVSRLPTRSVVRSPHSEEPASLDHNCYYYSPRRHGHRCGKLTQGTVVVVNVTVLARMLPFLATHLVGHPCDAIQPTGHPTGHPTNSSVIEAQL